MKRIFLLYSGNHNIYIVCSCLVTTGSASAPMVSVDDIRSKLRVLEKSLAAEKVVCAIIY